MKARREESGRSRNVCFTVNNYDGLLDPATWPGCTYCIYSEEISDTGTPHLQGYAEFAGAKTWVSLHENPGLEGARFASRVGKQSEAIRYCLPSKKGVDGVVDPSHLAGPYIYGEPKKQGERTDLAGVAELCIAGASLEAVALHDPSAFMRYPSGISKFHAMMQRPRRPDEGTACWVLYGSGGVGKTTTALRLAEYIGNGRVFMLSNRKGSGLYWDNYKQGDIVVIDEFNGSRMLPTEFNRLIDKGPCPIPTHGGSIQFNSPLVIITTNVSPRQWWPNVSFQKSLRRRIGIWPIFRSLSWKPTKKPKLNGVSALMSHMVLPGDNDSIFRDMSDLNFWNK